MKQLETNLSQTDSGGGNNLCTVAVSWLRSSFQEVESLFPGLVPIANGWIQCSLQEMVQSAEGSKFKNCVRLDVIAVRMKLIAQDAYSSLAKTTGDVQNPVL